MIFPDLSAIPENADKFSSQEFSPSSSASMPFSVQVDVSSAISPNTGSYKVMGSNISDEEEDMVDINDENGSSGERPLASPFVGKDFAFKYIGIKYKANGDVSAGTLSFHYEQKVRRVNLV